MLTPIVRAAPAALALAAVLLAPHPAPAAPGSDAAAGGPAIAWFAGDVDSAFARARAEHKPLFLYWGASWCPPCNQVKATLFKRHDFIERSSQFIPVYLDGDQASAQKLGDRFRVRGYPTMILFASDGSEITRLPGEIDPQQYLQVLSLGLGTSRSARATLAAALGPGAASLAAEDWTLLSSYAWDTDEGQLIAADRMAPTLLALAKACPPRYRASSDRLALRAIGAAAASRGTVSLDRASAVAQVQAVLQDPGRARNLFDLLTQWAPQIAGSLTDPGSPERKQLIEHLDARLAALAGDTGLSTADRLDALAARASLQKLADPNGPVAPLLRDTIRSAAAQADRDTTDRFERQAVISSAADALSAAGLDAESDALLKAELTRSVSPYYQMVELAVNARKRGDSAAALDWYEKAYAAAQGPATRLQWGARYVIALTELAPAQQERVDQAVARVIEDLDPAPETFYGRNRVALERLSAALQDWNSGHAHDPVLKNAVSRLSGVCEKVPESASERAVCSGVLRSPSP
ncbi:MAG TPA: thioredoxin family protein [Burkholderiaceae bacterium]|nr:thioredoxin family protein [Burkholderiaceae bacterium]